MNRLSIHQTNITKKPALRSQAWIQPDHTHEHSAQPGVDEVTGAGGEPGQLPAVEGGVHAGGLLSPVHIFDLRKAPLLGGGADKRGGQQPVSKGEGHQTNGGEIRKIREISVRHAGHGSEMAGLVIIVFVSPQAFEEHDGKGRKQKVSADDDAYHRDKEHAVCDTHFLSVLFFARPP